jgi:cytochrome c oxidase cbb3-type subunit III
MKNSFVRMARICVVFFIFFGLLEYFIDSGSQPAFIKYPIVLLVLAVFLVVLVAIEFIVAALNSIHYLLASEDKRREMLENQALPLRQKAWYKKSMQWLTGSQPIENEELLLLHHDYDGIRELDNNLPRWWLYLFYGGIIFGAAYFAHYQFLGGDDQETELRKEIAQANAEIEEYKKHAPDMMDEKSVTLLADAPSLQKGKAIYESNCAACHRTDGGGQIGPNLTDRNWIFGGDVKAVFHTITNGGRDGKGMVAWKGTLKPTEIQYAASYILSLQGSNPKDPKAPEGEVFETTGGSVPQPATIK